MKYQVLFSLKNNKKKISRLSSAAVVVGTLRVNEMKIYMQKCSSPFNLTSKLKVSANLGE